MRSIPGSFRLGPHEITVEVVSLEQMRAEHPDEPLGLWYRDSNRIVIQRTRPGFTKSAQLHTFWHELTHAVLETLSYDELSADEQFVDRLGLLLLQASQTFKK